MEKGNFIKLIESIKRQRDNDVSCSEKLSEVFGCFVLYDNDAIICGIIDFLRAELKDEDDWIGYYIFELGFGKENKNLKVLYKGIELPLKTPEDLWNILMMNFN